MCYQLGTSKELGTGTKCAYVGIIVLSFLGSLTWVKKLSIGFSKHLKKKFMGSKKKEA